MKKIIILIVSYVILFVSCTSNVIAPTYGLDFDHIANDVKPQGIFEDRSEMDWSDFEDLIDGSVNFNKEMILIVEKINSYSYYWVENGYNVIIDAESKVEIIWTVSTLKVVEVIQVGSDAKELTGDISVGDEFEVVEFYGESSAGRWIDNTLKYYHADEFKQSYVSANTNYHHLDFNKHYLYYSTSMVYGDENDRFAYGERISFDTVNFLDIHIPNELIRDKYYAFSAYEFSDDAYKKAKEFLSNLREDYHSKEVYQYYNVVVNSWENYGHLVQAEQQNARTPIILSITLGVIMLGIITVGIILRKRKTAAVPTDPTLPTDDEAPPEE